MKSINTLASEFRLYIHPHNTPSGDAKVQIQLCFCFFIIQRTIPIPFGKES